MKERRFIIVFAKEPRSGKVKTRLSDGLSPETIVGLYKAFLKDTVNLINECKTANKIMAYRADGNPSYLKRIASGYLFYKQEGASLGHRLHNAFAFAKANGATQTVIVGSDAPDLPVSNIKTAFRKLSSYDAVWGPARDGGYYLVGLRMPLRSLFQGIKWSGPSVLRQSLAKAAKARKKVYLLKEWHDVDTVEDVKRLKDFLNKKKSSAVHTRRFLNEKDIP